MVVGSPADAGIWRRAEPVGDSGVSGRPSPPSEGLFGALGTLRGVLEGICDDSEPFRVSFGPGFEAIGDCAQLIRGGIGLETFSLAYSGGI